MRCVNANKVCEIDSVELRRKRKRSPRQELELVSLLKDQIADLKRQLKDQNSSGSSPATPSGQVRPQVVLNHANSTTRTSSDTSSTLYITKSDLEEELHTLSDWNVSLKDIADQFRGFSAQRQEMLHKNNLVDVISLNLITKEEAEERLSLYHDVLYPHHPFVQVSPDLTVDDLIRDQPFLFNSIMHASSMVYSNQSIEKALALENQATSSVITEILVCGTKSVELIKSLVLFSVWYNTPECFRLKRYHLYTNIAMAIFHDLGIFKKSPYDPELRPDLEDLEQDREYRSLILTLYLCTVSFCLILRRTIHVKWTAYVEECCTIVERGENERHGRLALFLRLTHQLERVYHLVHFDGTIDGNARISKYAFDELLNSLEVVKPQIRKDDHIMLTFFYSIQAFLHQPLFEDLRIRDGGQNTKLSLSIRALDAIGHCTESCMLALGEFNQLTDEQIACLPLVHLSRVVYTAGILMRLRYFILSSPSLVEKELVPRHAVFAILTLCKRIQTASKRHPSTFLLTKMLLVLLLFINTYVTQTSELLLKDDTFVQQLPALLKRDRREMGLLANSILGPLQNSITGVVQAPCLHLELLSYAASEYRKNKENLFDPVHQVKIEETGPGSSLKPSFINGVGQQGGLSPGPRIPPLLGSDDLRRYSFRRPTFSRGDSVSGLPLSSNYVHTSQPREPTLSGAFDTDSMERRDSVLSIDDEFWANLLGTNADSFYFAQKSPLHSENVL